MNRSIIGILRQGFKNLFFCMSSAACEKPTILVRIDIAAKAHFFTNQNYTIANRATNFWPFNVKC